MSGHTPGPWSVIGGIGGWMVAAGPGPRVVRGSGGIPNEADARLIAAAPQLLAACVAILESAADKPTLWNTAALNRVEAAVDAAEGRS